MVKAVVQWCVLKADIFIWIWACFGSGLWLSFCSLPAAGAKMEFEPLDPHILAQCLHASGLSEEHRRGAVAPVPTGDIRADSGGTVCMGVLGSLLNMRGVKNQPSTTGVYYISCGNYYTTNAIKYKVWRLFGLEGTALLSPYPHFMCMHTYSYACSLHLFWLA